MYARVSVRVHCTRPTAWFFYPACQRAPSIRCFQLSTMQRYDKRQKNTPYARGYA